MKLCGFGPFFKSPPKHEELKLICKTCPIRGQTRNKNSRRRVDATRRARFSKNFYFLELRGGGFASAKDLICVVASIRKPLYFFFKSHYFLTILNLPPPRAKTLKMVALKSAAKVKLICSFSHFQFFEILIFFFW